MNVNQELLSASELKTLLELAALMPGMSQALCDLFREHVKAGEVDFLLVAIPKRTPAHPVFTASVWPDRIGGLRVALNGALDQIERNGPAVRLAASAVQGHA